ncbi:MAG TPA: DUF2061 domain-containing protein [Candidatus Kaiserbacteria bacterium]|nr:DUF2061 domain-containing protein [Candidatus Kaiserbacteria bacterium]
MDSKKRSIVKAVSWRIIATLLIGIIAYIFTGAVVSSIELTLTAAVINTIFYYFHERAWSTISWGKG